MQSTSLPLKSGMIITEEKNCRWAGYVARVPSQPQHLLPPFTPPAASSHLYPINIALKTIVCSPDEVDKPFAVSYSESPSFSPSYHLAIN